MSKIITVYFSIKGQTLGPGMTTVNQEKGNTAIATEFIHNTVGGDLFEIEAARTYSEDHMELISDMVLLMRLAYDVEYNFFDTAPIYVEANERYLGKAVEPFRSQLDASLKRINMDYIDLYYQHRIDPKTSTEEVADAMALGAFHLHRRTIYAGHTGFAEFQRLKICTHLWLDKTRKRNSSYARSLG